MSIKTAIVVPCYNEELRLQQDHFVNFVALHHDIDFWFINDGSTDDTLGIIMQMSNKSPDRIFVHSLSANSGKAEAVRQGICLLSNTEKYNYIGFIDADLSAPLTEIVKLLHVLNNESTLFAVVGARVKMLGRRIQRNNLRYYVSRVFTTYYNSILKLPNYDTQCGLKLFVQKVAETIFLEPFFSKWLFDIEIFLRIRNLVGRDNYSKHILEVPLDEWREINGSKVKLIDFIKAPIEVLRLYKKYKVPN